MHHHKNNKITVEHGEKYSEFIYTSETEKNAKRTFQVLTEMFDTLNYNTSDIKDHCGNTIAKLTYEKHYAKKNKHEWMSTFLGWLFS